MYSYTHSLTLTLDEGQWSASRSARFTPRERAPGTHWIGIWVGPRAVLDVVVKRKIPSPRRESNPRTPIVQPLPQRYTNWAITALGYFTYRIRFWSLLYNHHVIGCHCTDIFMTTETTSKHYMKYTSDNSSIRKNSGITLACVFQQISVSCVEVVALMRCIGFYVSSQKWMIGF
jgi:hypothetical protein